MPWMEKNRFYKLSCILNLYRLPTSMRISRGFLYYLGFLFKAGFLIDLEFLVIICFLRVRLLAGKILGGIL